MGCVVVGTAVLVVGADGAVEIVVGVVEGTILRTNNVGCEAVAAAAAAVAAAESLEFPTRDTTTPTTVPRAPIDSHHE